MFQNLRVGSPIYILHKNEPKLIVGEVSSVSLPVPVTNQVYQAGVFQQQKTTVDVKVRVDGEIVDYKKIPSDLSIADFGTGMVISETKDAIINEIQILKNNSANILDSIDKHKKIMEECDIMLQTLSPIVKQEAERSKEMEAMRTEMKELKEMLAQVLKPKKS